mmetsp:Transcript_18183/g.59748  ORF Transcript_18183/g.59748 Transcript_18183/m.59748 type:complete len:211 (+) Transcript_18183:960-1592(+)
MLSLLAAEVAHDGDRRAPVGHDGHGGIVHQVPADHRVTAQTPNGDRLRPSCSWHFPGIREDELVAGGPVDLPQQLCLVAQVLHELIWGALGGGVELGAPPELDDSSVGPDHLVVDDLHVKHPQEVLEANLGVELGRNFLEAHRALPLEVGLDDVRLVRLVQHLPHKKRLRAAAGQNEPQDVVGGHEERAERRLLACLLPPHGVVQQVHLV